MFFELPSSPHSLCEDRFSLTDFDTELVPAWSIIEAVLADHPQSPSDLIGQLDTLSVAFRGSAISNCVFLKRFLFDTWDFSHFLKETWPRCVQIALEMPTLFPRNSLPPLTHDDPMRRFTRRQIACLVIHQFLCTFARPSWMQRDGSPDFHIWYADEQPHPKAVQAYLHALFTYFDRVSTESHDTEMSISFTLQHTRSTPLIPPSTGFGKVNIVELATPIMAPYLLGLSSGACVISANKYVGFGRTASQEEIHVGSTPEACPVVLMMPPLGDGDALVVRGTEAIIEMEGYGRDATMRAILNPGAWDWRERTMLFMDALELDSFDTREGRFIPDLLPGNVDREFTKAYTAFQSGHDSVELPHYTEVVTGLWGCRAFGGNAQIKTIIQWCAASLSGVPLTFMCESNNVGFLAVLRDFIEHVEAEHWTVNAVLQILLSLHPEDIGGRSAFDHVIQVYRSQTPVSNPSR